MIIHGRSFIRKSKLQFIWKVRQKVEGLNGDMMMNKNTIRVLSGTPMSDVYFSITQCLFLKR